ncbi:carbonic anhydrase [Deinococcus sp. Arct2-2]|uniref:beta-class carbonic anhydrase n=1 Tax=Deinococcus sp. Arct2-2 TaxID=2568653 RepID=UPI0010A4782F|nr:carbonic anhydrase [Deinococcus sp. Arct2-2]THF70791.1 carbonic anhydrase [Deinococcus sp. Arct2-2]
MSTVLDEILAANAQYVTEFGERAALPLPPGRKFAILTCMDARLDPAHFAGLKEGDAHVIRNAGGRASDDAIRSLVISHKLLGTQEFFVVHHTNCGMQLFTNDIMGDLLSQSLETAVVDEHGWHDVGQGPGSPEGRGVDWLTFEDLAQSVRDDVQRIRQSALVPENLPVRGFIYDVTTGGLQEVSEEQGA